MYDNTNEAQFGAIWELTTENSHMLFSILPSHHALCRQHILSHSGHYSSHSMQLCNLWEHFFAQILWQVSLEHYRSHQLEASVNNSPSSAFAL